MKVLNILRPAYLVVALALSFLAACENGQEASSTYRLSEADKAKLKQGDIILRYGKGLASDLIVRLLNEERKISHCGILSRDPDSSFRVIHSVSSSISDADGMQETELSSFLAESVDSSIMVVRYEGRSDSLPPSRIAKRAEHYLRRELPFDPEFDLKDSGAIYCSELIERSVQDVFDRSLMSGFTERPYGNLRFDVFWRSEQLRTVIDHHR